MSSLKSRLVLDITVDSWSWILSKTYAVFSYATYGPLKNGNNLNHYRVVRRVYKCQSAEDLKNA